MKKFMTAFLVMSLIICGYSCGKKQTKDNPDISQSLESSEIQQEIIQPDPYSVKTSVNISSSVSTTERTAVTSGQTTSSVTTVTATGSITTSVNEDFSEPDPLGGGAFSYDKNGALQFSEEIQTDNDRLLMSAAQALFESACRFQWGLTVGCPYEIDMDSVVENGFGWKYYRITDESIHSFADIENLYYGVFSERYPNEDLKMLYLEYEGNVYALNGQREMNAYYSVSKITDIQSRTDDEIFFTVENHYEGTDLNPDESYSETETFSMVLAGNKIRVGQFRLPY
ncbi:MAG: hypothetical protein K2G14_01950 [Ruminococcus sp.]|nr:hypothetical protein [Ruminococcus sp.]